MNCPRCHVALLIADRQGIEIDYCGQCRGVWLDRGELDKLVERASRFNDRDDDDDHRPPPLPGARPGYRDDDDRDERYRDDRSRDNRYYHKRKSFWGELFD